METKKRLALITTWFPPQKSVATNRMEAFATYLSDVFEVEVFALNDHSFTNLWNEKVTVHYEKSNALFERLKSKQEDGKLKHKLRTLGHVLLLKLVSNPMEKWKNATLKKLQNRHKEQPFDVIISSYAPVEPHLIASAFIENNPTVIWVADMRDEMSKNPGVSGQLKEKNRAVELLVNEQATVITSVSLPILNDFKVLCPKVKYFLEVRNGFNHEFKFEVQHDTSQVLKLGYFGSFYGAIKPTNLFQALVELRNFIQFEFHVYGAFSNFEIPNDIKKSVFVYPSLPYQDAILKMNTMDANIVIHPTNERKGVYTGKLFDYFSARKPILALMDESDVAAELIRSFNCGYVCDNSDIEGIKGNILSIQNDKQKHQLKVANQENIDSLHRSIGVRSLTKLIHAIINENPASRS